MYIIQSQLILQADPKQVNSKLFNTMMHFSSSIVRFLNVKGGSSVDGFMQTLE